MNSSLQQHARRGTVSRALALALMAPAAALATLPAAAAIAAPVRAAPAPAIHNLQVDADDGLSAGSQLQFTVQGTPRGQARIGLDGNRIGIALRETAPGTYQGLYTVRRADSIDPGGQIRISLISGKNSAVAHYNYPSGFVAAAAPPVLVPPPPPVAIVRPPPDNSAPVIGNLMPRHNDSLPPGRNARVAATFDDGDGRGVDPDGVRILLSGRDVTGESRITGHDFAFRGPLPPGRHTVEVTARDRAGNTTTKTWSFDVGSAMGAAPVIPLPPPLQLLSPGNNAVIDSDRLTVQGRTAPGAMVRVKVDAVAPARGNRMAVAEPVFARDVQADANGVFSFSLPPQRATPLGGTRFEVSVEASQGGQTSESRLVLFERG